MNASFDNVQHSMAQQGLVRPQQQKVLAGVCAGLGRRFGINPWPARVLFVLILLVVPGSQILVYAVLWILMPAAQDSAPEVYPAAGPPKVG